MKENMLQRREGKEASLGQKTQPSPQDAGEEARAQGGMGKSGQEGTKRRQMVPGALRPHRGSKPQVCSDAPAAISLESEQHGRMASTGQRK